MHWLGGNKETSIKQIEFKSSGRAGSQRASPGNGFGLHWDSRGPSLQFADKGRGWGGLGTARGRHFPTSHPHPSTLDPCVAHLVSSSHTGGISKHCQAVCPSTQLLHKALQLWDSPHQNFVSSPPSSDPSQALDPLCPSQNPSSGSAWPC